MFSTLKSSFILFFGGYNLFFLWKAMPLFQLFCVMWSYVHNSCIWFILFVSFSCKCTLLSLLCLSFFFYISSLLLSIEFRICSISGETKDIFLFLLFPHQVNVSFWMFECMLGYKIIRLRCDTIFWNLASITRRPIRYMQEIDFEIYIFCMGILIKYFTKNIIFSRGNIVRFLQNHMKRRLHLNTWFFKLSGGSVIRYR